MKELTSLERTLLSRKDAVFVLRDAGSIQVIGGFIIHSPLIGLLFVDIKNIKLPGAQIDYLTAIKRIKSTYHTR